MEIKRDIYLNKLINKKHNGLIKVVTGIRRCGKSDLGSRNAHLNFPQLEETHTMENIIFNELKIRGFNVDVGVVTLNKTNNEKGHGIRKQVEIDFVCNKGSKRYYIQSAYAIPDQEKMKQEQRSLMLTGDFFKKIIYYTFFEKALIR